tara:strand:+ start:151 stop:633 length:483 start_codon:yes stop_codon:yes gene_type:complete
MFDILSGGLLGSLFGGLFRLAPEVLKWLDKKNERQHELSMFTLQTDLEKIRGTFKIEEKYVEHSTAQIDAIKAAFDEQAKTASASYKWVAALSALVRPVITYALFGLYICVKISAMIYAMNSGASWRDMLVDNWDADDFAMLNMILTFWFVGRSIEKYQK